MPGSPSSPLAPIGPAKPSCPGGPDLPASPVAPLWPFSPLFRQRKRRICGSSVSVEGKPILLLLLKPLNVPYWSKCTWPLTASTADRWTCHLPFLLCSLVNKIMQFEKKKALCDITNVTASSLRYKTVRSGYIQRLLTPFKQVEVQTKHEF